MPSDGFYVQLYVFDSLFHLLAFSDFDLRFRLIDANQKRDCINGLIKYEKNLRCFIYSHFIV